jgi:hypothetical protein
MDQCLRRRSPSLIGVYYPAVEIESPIWRVAATIRLVGNEGGVLDTALWLADSDLQQVDAEFHRRRLGTALMFAVSVAADQPAGKHCRWNSTAFSDRFSMMNHDEPAGSVTLPSYDGLFESAVSRTSDLSIGFLSPDCIALMARSVTTVMANGPCDSTRNEIAPPLLEVTSRVHSNWGGTVLV